MKKYENAKVELISFETNEDILTTSNIGPVLYDNGAIDGELDYANEVGQ
ncbi:MAG: hypothetical protein IJ011_00380 [Clostridia bacterium]|nr:hypothetical protein [Clostridia bacterium]